MTDVARDTANPCHVWVLGSRLWESVDDGAHWTAIPRTSDIDRLRVADQPARSRHEPDGAPTRCGHEVTCTATARNKYGEHATRARGRVRKG